MRRTYLVLAVIGFIVPNIFVALESFQTGNKKPVLSFQNGFLPGLAVF